MFTEKTITKFMTMAKALLEKLLPVLLTLSVVISNGNKKIGHVLNVSLLPIFSCGNCGKCSRFCYDLKACLRFPGTLLARAVNYVLAIYNPESYFNQIIIRIMKRDRSGRGIKAFRWHVGGDIPNMAYFDSMVRIARMFPEWRFWTYTKMFGIVNMYVASHGGSREAAIPENLSIMFSEWDEMDTINPYGFATFRCIMPDSRPLQDDEIYCPGNCETCLKADSGCPAQVSAATKLH